MTQVICPTKACPISTVCPSKTPSNGSKFCQNCSVYNCASCSQYNIGICHSCRQGYSRSSNGCRKCVEGCQECEDQYCLKCLPGYRKINQLCVKCKQHCNQCNNKDECLACEQGYILDKQNCVYCGLGCKSCSGISQCQTCQDGFRFQNQQCIKCADGCKICSTSATCSQCQPSFMLQGNACNPCPVNCLNCSSTTTCTTCQDNSILAAGSCKKCQENCLACASDSVCGICREGFILQNEKCLIMECDAKLPCHTDQKCVKDETGNRCVQTPQYCETVNKKGLCEKCLLPFIAVDGYCKNCALGCDTCISDKLCAKCKPFFFLNSQKECQVCHSSCAICTSVDNCTQCVGSHVLYQNKCYMKGDNQCNDKTLCDAKEFCKLQTWGNQCRSCLANCQTCKDATTCDLCVEGYYFENGKCNLCPSQCKTCENKDSCSSCNDGMYISGTKSCIEQLCTVSKPCVDGQFCQIIDSGNQCTKCHESCKTCSDSTTCDSCKDGLDLSDSKKCVENQCSEKVQCQKSHFCQNLVTGNICKNCSENCLSCTDSNTCTSCNSAFYLNSKVCKKCPQFCMECSPNGTCTKCQQNSRLSSTAQCVADACNNSQKCTEGEFCTLQDAGNICTKCHASCKTCSDSITCDSCQDGLDLSTSKKCVNNQCSKNLQCQKNYFCQKLETGNLCQACPKNCETCTEANTCSGCAENYFLNVSEICAEVVCSASKPCKEQEFCFSSTSGNECKVCPENCKSCDSSGECNTCMETFSVNRGRCLNAAVPIGVGAIVGILVGVLLVVSVLAGLGVYYSILKKKKANATVLEQDNVQLATVPVYDGMGNGGTLVKQGFV
ncbi:Cysteine-rich membrane protein 2 [Spironucleus salmonicida]|uniref:Cysteine-rich membrane protein 2 n=1 Tax=Spironucleus salmonicida TaxID=348837 RepID=V6LKK1_9EUKA|nr:Cysteine-rich membrane protein 2 [Spironucleus salmonicida]|eukprot:EST44883.1 Cysteine-rich membrane protein 2 [Spironucleus salmonicida]